MNQEELANLVAEWVKPRKKMTLGAVIALVAGVMGLLCVAGLGLALYMRMSELQNQAKTMQTKLDKADATVSAMVYALKATSSAAEATVAPKIETFTLTPPPAPSATPTMPPTLTATPVLTNGQLLTPTKPLTYAFDVAWVFPVVTQVLYDVPTLTLKPRPGWGIVADGASLTLTQGATNSIPIAVTWWKDGQPVAVTGITTPTQGGAIWLPNPDEVPVAEGVYQFVVRAEGVLFVTNSITVTNPERLILASVQARSDPELKGSTKVPTTTLPIGTEIQVYGTKKINSTNLVYFHPSGKYRREMYWIPVLPGYLQTLDKNEFVVSKENEFLVIP